MRSGEEQREVLTQTGKAIFGAINMEPKKRKTKSAPEPAKPKRTYKPCPVCSKSIVEDVLDKHMADSHPRGAKAARKAAAPKAKRGRKPKPDEVPGVAIEPRTDSALVNDAQGWADLIGVEYRNAVEDIIKIGLALAAAKDSLPHGEFGRIFADHDNPVEHPVPFSKWSGQQFMKIASNPAITNTGYSQHLPAAWRTLAYLAPLPAPLIEAHIKDGTITPNLKQNDAYNLQREWKQSSPSKTRQTRAPDERLRVAEESTISFGEFDPAIVEAFFLQLDPEEIVELLFHQLELDEVQAVAKLLAERLQDGEP